MAHVMFSNYFSKIMPFVRYSGKNSVQLDSPQVKNGAWALHAGYLRLLTHIQNCNNGCTNTPQSYSICYVTCLVICWGSSKVSKLYHNSKGLLPIFMLILSCILFVRDEYSFLNIPSSCSST
jgi:hypothetical protein